MKHLILFENYFETFNESVENLKSGVKLYSDEKESKSSTSEMVATLGKINGKRKASIRYSVSGNKNVTLTFTEESGISYKTKGGFGTPVVKESGQEVKDAGIIYQKVEGDEIVTIPYKGTSDGDFSNALGLFLLSSGGLQNFKIAEMTINNIYEIGESKMESKQLPPSLERGFVQLKRALKDPSVTIISDNKDMDKKLKASLKAFVSKL